MFLQLLVLVVQNREPLLAVGDVGRRGRELVRPENLLQLGELLLFFLENVINRYLGNWSPAIKNIKI